MMINPLYTGGVNRVPFIDTVDTSGSDIQVFTEMAITSLFIGFCILHLDHAKDEKRNIVCCSWGTDTIAIFTKY